MENILCNVLRNIIMLSNVVRARINLHVAYIRARPRACRQRCCP